MSSVAPPTPPCRRALRARLFWAARWMLGGAEYHCGSIRVVIDTDTNPRPAETLVILPGPDDEVIEPAGPPALGPAGAVAPRLLATCLSPRTLSIMRFIGHRQPVMAKVIAAGVGIERSKLYVLLIELRDRGLVRDAGEGYVIAEPEAWDAVCAAAEAETAPA